MKYDKTKKYYVYCYKEVIVKGVTYSSITEASIKLGVSRTTIGRWLGIYK
jgi:hypothetical protein